MGPSRKLVGGILGSVSLALVAGLTTPASATPSDPENRSVAPHLGHGETYTEPGFAIPLDARAFVSSAVAASRIRQLVPHRLTYPSVGRNIAVNVTDALTGRPLYGYRRDTPMLPASNMKIVTATTALRVFGPNKRFETKVVSLGPGRVALVGGGDATLSTSGLQALAALTTAALHHEPSLMTPNHSLQVLIDDSLFPSPVRPSGWRGGYEPDVVRPVRALGIDGQYVMDSGRNAANVFAAAMKNRGFRTAVLGRANSTGRPTLARYLGANLGAQIRYMLQVSENNVAEMLFRNVAVGRGLRPTWANSSRAAKTVLGELNVPTARLSLTSGSGVSRNDRLTPLALTTVLSRIANPNAYPELKPIYFGGGLPLAGRSGTLSSSSGRFNTQPTVCARGRIRAKTGTLFDTIGLSGLTTGRDGRLKAFSILVNSRPQNHEPIEARRSVDRIAATVNGCF